MREIGFKEVLVDDENPKIVAPKRKKKSPSEETSHLQSNLWAGINAWYGIDQANRYIAVGNQMASHYSNQAFAKKTREASGWTDPRGLYK